MGLPMVWQLASLSVLLTNVALAADFWAFHHWTSGNIFTAFGIFVASLAPLGVAILVADMARRDPADSHSMASLLYQYNYSLLIPDLTGHICLAKVQKNINSCRETQERALLQIINENKDTIYGRDHNMCDVKSREELVSKHPLTGYNHYEKYADRVAQGEKNVMTSKSVILLAMSSGTTGKNKMYPYTFGNLDKYPALHISVSHSHKSFYSFGLKRVFEFRLCHPSKTSPGGVPMGGVGSLWVESKKNVVPNICNKIFKEEPSFYVQSLFALRERELGHIDGFSSDLMYALFNYMYAHHTDLCDDIANGAVSPMNDLSEDIRQDINKRLRPEPERASELRAAFSASRRRLAKRLWPGLVSANVTRTGGFAPSLKLLEDSYLKDVPCNMFYHAGTEGIYGMQLEKDDDLSEVYTMVPDMCFMEFIPVEEMHTENPKTYFMDELKKNQSYEMVVTNIYGLYRNRFGDVIKVVGFNGNTPKYEFMYRTGQILNVAYDRTPENILAKAVQTTVVSWAGFTLVSFTATESHHLWAAIGQDTSSKYEVDHYVIFIEVDTEASVKYLSQDQKEYIEDTLCEMHEAYRDFRGQCSLGPARVVQVKVGTFKELRYELTGRQQTMQFKTPRVLRKPPALRLLWDSRCHDGRDESAVNTDTQN